MWKVQLFELNYDHREEDAVAQVLQSRWITMGERTKMFEKSFGEYLESKNLPTAVSSATAALHMALLALNVGPGDEVIISGQTFVADANTVTIVGAKPVLADVTSLDDWNVSAETISQCITPRTKAVMIVHFAGVPCEIDEIVELCKSKGLALIEDVAHAPGATYKGVKCGNFGDIAAFSFFTNKNLSVGEGGMVIAKDSDTNNRLKYLRSHGMSSLTLDRHQGRAVSYDVLQAGLNYRIDEMRAAIGIVQLEKLDEANDKRRQLHEYYTRRLSEISEVFIPFARLKDKTSAYHIYPILLAKHLNREKVFNSLKALGIQASIHYPSLKSFTAYAQDFKECQTPFCDIISEHELTLPLYPTMSFEQADIVIDSLINSIKEQV